MPKRIPIIAANWKMHKTAREVKDFLALLQQQLPTPVPRVFISPPFTALAVAAQVVQGTSFVVGAQNMHEAKEGAFTGEISGGMLRDAGARFVLLGHSERRHLFHETEATVHLKLKTALAASILPILCIGETLEERNAGKTFAVLKTQIKSALSGCGPGPLVLAYEPVWAIGTGQTATPSQAQEAHLFCRTLLVDLWGKEAAEGTSILYGGSVTPETAPSLAKEHDIDGALVGGASLDVSKFIQIIKGFSV